MPNNTEFSEIFLKKYNPTLIFNLSEMIGVKLYEHPTLGDEAGMIALVNTNDGWRVVPTSIPMDVYSEDMIIEACDFKKEIMASHPHWFE